MKIAVVSDEHFPAGGADTEVIVNTAAALGRAGADVTLVVPWLPRKERLDEICRVYGVEPSFKLAPLFTWPLPTRTLRIEKLSHGLLAALHPAVRHADVVHSRDYLPLIVAQAARLPWSFETYRRHAAEKPWLPRLLRRAGLGRAVGAIAHSAASREDLVSLGFPDDGVIVVRPGFALSAYETALTREEARARVGLPQGRPIVGYAGNIHVSKGMEQLLELAELMPDVSFVIVGGSPADVAELDAERRRRGTANVELLGRKLPSELPPYLFAADVLFAPYLASNVRDSWIAKRLDRRIIPGTPLKLFGYLAAGRPIVAADMPQHRDLLHDGEDSLFFPAGRLDLARDAVRRLLYDPALAARLGQNGRRFVASSSWDARGRAMLDFFERRLSSRRSAS